MMSPDHKNNPAKNRLEGANVARGALVTATALFVGLIVVLKGFSGNEQDLSSSAENKTVELHALETNSSQSDSPQTSDAIVTPLPAETTSPLSTEMDPLPPTSKTPKARPPGEVTVLVVNSKAGSGVAAAGSTLLQTKGYITREPTNAKRKNPTAVFFLEGFEAEAETVAKELGITDTTLVMPYPTDRAPLADTSKVNIVVVISNDGVIPKKNLR